MFDPHEPITIPVSMSLKELAEYLVSSGAGELALCTLVHELSWKIWNEEGQGQGPLAFKLDDEDFQALAEMVDYRRWKTEMEDSK